jgi:subtilisin family serine protease
MAAEDDGTASLVAGKAAGKKTMEHAASQSTPNINIEPPPEDDQAGQNRGRKSRIKPPSPVPPSEASSTARDGQKHVDDNLDAAKTRTRANSTGSTASMESVLERIKQNVRYVTPISSGDKLFNFVASRNPKGSEHAQSESGTPGMAHPVWKAGPGNKNKTPRGGQGNNKKQGPNQPRKGKMNGGGLNTDKMKRSQSQENLTVPEQKKNGNNPGKGRASSVPRRGVEKGPPLFDVQVDGGGWRKRKLANEWFQKLEEYTETLISNYATSEYEKVRIAVLDTGVEKSLRRKTSEFIRQRGKQIKDGRSFVVNDKGEQIPWNNDVNGHGTHVTGLLLRVAPRAEIYVARILRGWEQTIDPKAVEEALKCCIDEWKVDIITMSFGFEKYHAGIEAQLNRALGEHILIFAAASNDGASKSINVAWPAREKTVFAIFSATGEGKSSSFNPPSVRGLNFATLGEEVESDWPLPLMSDEDKEQGRSTVRKSGTSFATPIAAAIAALVLEFARQPPLSEETPEVARQLKKLDRMEEVFERMSERTMGGYHYVYPWRLFNAREGRGTSEGDAHNRHSARGIVEGELVRLVGSHVQIFGVD